MKIRVVMGAAVAAAAVLAGCGSHSTTAPETEPSHTSSSTPASVTCSHLREVLRTTGLPWPIAQQPDLLTAPRLRHVVDGFADAATSAAQPLRSSLTTWVSVMHVATPYLLSHDEDGFESAVPRRQAEAFLSANVSLANRCQLLPTPHPSPNQEDK